MAAPSFIPSALEDVRETPVQRDKRLGVKCPKQNYHWAELKSSLYVKALIDDNQKLMALRNFWKAVAESLFPAGAERDDIIDAFIATDRKSANQYPIGGYLNMLFKGIETFSQQAKRDAIMDNLFGVYNLIRWFGITVGLNQIRQLQMNSPITVFYYMFHGVQTPIARFMQYIRGRRVNYKFHKVYSPQIGITSIREDTLKHNNFAPLRADGKPTEHEGWNHTGQSECRMSYTGQYGARIKHARAVNDPKGRGSLQCGVSGSAQFTLFFVLSAIVANPNGIGALDKTTVLKHLFDAAIIFLNGDGGHSMYEILYGLTTSFIVLKNLLRNHDLFADMMSIALQKSLGAADLATSRGLVDTFIQTHANGLAKMSEFIDDWYEKTKNVNPTLDFTNMDGVNAGQVSTYIINDILRKDYNYNENDARYQADYDNIVKFLALDAKRYKKSEKDADRMIESLLHPDLKPGVNARIKTLMEECDLEKLTDYKQRADDLIFAFGDRRRSRKSARKSSVRRTHKSPSRRKASIRRTHKSPSRRKASARRKASTRRTRKSPSRKASTCRK